MSEDVNEGAVTRWECEAGYSHEGQCEYVHWNEDAEGLWVKHKDHARIVAELRAEASELQSRCDHIINRSDTACEELRKMTKQELARAQTLLHERDELRAEVEAAKKERDRAAKDSFANLSRALDAEERLAAVDSGRVVEEAMVERALKSGPIPGFVSFGALLKKVGITGPEDWIRAALLAALGADQPSPSAAKDA